MPNIVLFSGHMLDRPGRNPPRFPSCLEIQVRDAIVAHLANIDAQVGYAAAACGSDILFHEAMLARGGKIHIVLPFAPDEFVNSSVIKAGGESWRTRFYQILERAEDITLAKWSARDHQGGQDYADGNMLMTQLALNALKINGGNLSGLVVWDRLPGDGAGGTASMAAYWPTLGLNLQIIDVKTWYGSTIHL